MTQEASSQPEPTTPHEAARLYASLGYHVIPIKEGGKHPPIPDWWNAATTGPDMIDRWWTGIHKKDGVGIATGYNGVFVLDVDVGPGKAGDETLHDLEQEHGTLPLTVEQQTGSGGRHLFYRSPPGVEIRNSAGNRLGHGLDIRGGGGQVVAAPTIHPNGQPYIWYMGCAPWERDVADAPAWLIGMLTDEIERPLDVQGVDVKRTGASLSFERPGDRFNQTTTWETLLTADGWTRTKDGYDRHEQRWVRPGKDARDGISATVNANGTDRLHVFTSSVPTLDPDQSYSRFGYWTATRHAGDFETATRALGDLERADVASVIGAWGTHAETPAETGVSHPSTEAGGGNGSLASPQDSPASLLDRLRASLLTMGQLRNLPKPSWRIDNVFYDGAVVLLWSPPGSFKSFIAADMALAIAYGKRWQDHLVQHGPVIYFAGEGKGLFQQRIDAWTAQHHLMDTDAFVLGPLMPNLSHAEWRGAAYELALERTPALVVFDTVARAMVGGEENSAKDMGLLVDVAGRIAQDTGSVVLLVHHSTKGGEQYRGSSALQGAVDTEIEVQRNGMNVTLHCRKQKDANEFQPLQLHLEPCMESLVVQRGHNHEGVDVDNHHQAILDVLTSTGTSTYGQLEKRCGVPPSTFQRKLKDLLSLDMVTKTSEGKYDLVE